MSPTSHPLRRPSLGVASEAVILTAVLCATLALISVPTTRAAGDPLGSDSPAPSPGVSVIPDPSLVEPTASPDPATDPSAVPTSAPTPTPDPTLPPEPGPLPPPSADPAATPSPSVVASEPPAVLPGLHVDHVWIDTLDRRTGDPTLGALDAPQAGATRGTLYVVRFQLVNESDSAAEVRPQIDFAAATNPGTWSLVPAVNPVDGVALYSSSNVLRGQDPAVNPIPASGLRLATSGDPVGSAVPGLDHAGVNPGGNLTMAPHTFTEVAFTVRATADATWLGTYLVRLSDAGQAISGPAVATLTLRASPPVVLSPGQHTGTRVPGPFRLLVGDNALAAAQGGPAAPAAPSAFTSPHGPYDLTSDACAACHALHTAQAPMLLVRPAPQSAMCFTCHDGSGADSNIAAQYADPTVPANDSTTGSYYSHPATTLSNHSSDQDPTEFAGVTNRHSSCADCHSPHRADGTPAVETSAGWTASGALVGASGVAVVNGPAGSAPTSSTWVSAVTYEYQLCFKCHSGFTRLNPQTGGPSTWALDKAVELNPANLSYHPIEAPGKNTTAQMTRSLSGTSPYKLWTFTTASTIRCVSCHGDPRLANPASPPAAGAALAPHAVANRSMLIQPYRDRQLKGSSEAYNAADFALCYVCHAEAPFVDTSQNPRLDTRFPLHGTHVAGIASFTGAGGSIDTDGAGHGNALCAECHFRIHGTTFSVDGQAPTSRLVNFAPDVQPYQGSNPLYHGQLTWTGSSCTLTCHGVDHAAWSY